jgi:hypothetical protein
MSVLDNGVELKPHRENDRYSIGVSLAADCRQPPNC